MKKKKKLLFKIIEEIILFIIGGFIYAGIEILARGFTHWTMILVGGLCFIIIGLLNEFYNWNMLFQYQCFIGGGIITILELISGYIINIQLGLNVWDYSDRMFNFKGQICLQNSIYWILLSIVAIILDDYIRYKLFHEKFPKYHFSHHKI